MEADTPTALIGINLADAGVVFRMSASRVEDPWRRTLRPGMKGRDVALLQERLSCLGYYASQPDGMFGILTAEALRSFQKAHRLHVDGIAGREVFAVLRSRQAKPEMSHIVRQGDTLSTVARLYNVPIELLLRANRLESPRVHEGQCLAIPVSRLIGYYAGNADGQGSSESYERHLGFISAVAPRWFHLNPDGVVCGEPARKVGALASLAGIAVFAVIASGPPGPAPAAPSEPEGSPDSGSARGFHDVLMDAAARRRAIRGIVEATAKSRAQGAILSVSKLSSDCSYALTSFVRELSRTLAETGRSLAVDVPSPDLDGLEPLRGPVEYGEIAQVASQVILRLYEEPEALPLPGPAASPARARTLLKMLVRVVPPWKLVLGVPAFGIDFSCAPGAPPMRKKHSEVADILDIFRPTVTRIESGGPCVFRYRSFRVNHTVFFEDATSIGAHVDLALKFNLAGLALADLGEEDPEAWDAIKTRFKVLRDSIPPATTNRSADVSASAKEVRSVSGFSGAPGLADQHGGGR